MDIEYCDRLFSDHFFQSEDQCAGNGFRIHGSLLSWNHDRIFPAVSKKEVTFSGNILSDMVRMYYQETVPILQYRTDYKDKKEEDLVQQDYYFQDDETTDEVVEEVKKEEKLFHAKKWENSKYLRKYIYQIDSTTMATENELNGKVLLNTNLKLRKSDEPQILIYHTHGSEAYRGSRKGRKSDTVIGVGDVLTKRLEQKKIKVIHDRNIYDVKTEKRSDPRLIIMQQLQLKRI